MCADGVPIMLRNRCKPNFLVNTPDRFKRFRMYWPHRHFPCVTRSCVGTTAGSFHPIVLDNFRVTTSLTLLNRRRAETVFGSVSNDVVFKSGKLNFRLVSTIGSESGGCMGSVGKAGTFVVVGVGGVVIIVAISGAVKRGFVIVAVSSVDVPT